MEKIDELAAAARVGDRDAFEQLAAATQAPVWRFAYASLRNRELADEASQETWLRVVRSLPKFRGDSSVLTWMLAIERRVIADILKRESRSATRFDRPVDDELPYVSVELRLELDRLAAPMREAFLLTQLIGLSYAEAARVMQVKVGTVRSRVFRAREALVKVFRDEDMSLGGEKQ